MADESQNLFQEIDEALRADKMQALWDEHKQTIIGCCLAVVLGTSASVAWHNYQDSRAEKATLKLIEGQTLLDEQNYTKAAEVFAKTAENYSREAPVALLKRAEALVLAGQKEDAAKALDASSSDKGLGAFMHLEAAAAGNTDEKTLRRLAASDGPLHASAQELLALHAIQEGNKDEAEKLLAQIRDDSLAPSTLRTRAAQILHVIKQ